MKCFSINEDKNENVGELILEILLNSNIDSIIELNLSENESWFKKPNSTEERTSSVDLLVELISKQPGLELFNI